VSGVGLLIVSHSRKLAEGVRELAEQVAQGRVPIAAVGGMADGSLGTNADDIRAAAEQLASASVDGVAVLLDMGSAVMSTELALEGFDTPHRICNAPLVEGAIVAAVEASIGSDLAATAAAAEGASQLRKVAVA
jgi:phosphoenolpyruvate---glycerone phosphotransferase subunit DhaM